MHEHANVRESERVFGNPEMMRIGIIIIIILVVVVVVVVVVKHF